MIDDPGKLWALLSTLCWTVSTLAFTNAGRRIGSLPVNVIRMTLAVALFMMLEFAYQGQWLPLNLPPRVWFWLSLSGFVGFFGADLFMFKAMTLIGSRLPSLIVSLAIPTAAIVGWLWVDEALGPLSLVGMAVTITGVSWVVMEQQTDRNGVAIQTSLRGIIYAIIGAVGQGIGMVIAKVGITPLPGAEAAAAPNAFQISLIRALAGAIGFALLTCWLRRWPAVARACRQRRPLAITSLGAIAGPFLGVTLLMRSIQTIPTGMAQTIVSIVPVLILPFIVLIEKERVSWRAVLGALIAVGGVSLLIFGAGQG